jgi:hypothetical protein
MRRSSRQGDDPRISADAGRRARANPEAEGRSKSEDEVVAAKPNADFDAKFRVHERAISNFIRVVCRSLKN